MTKKHAKLSSMQRVSMKHGFLMISAPYLGSCGPVFKSRSGRAVELMTICVVLHCTEPFIITPSSWYDFNPCPAEPGYTNVPCFANSVDPDQLASEEANWSGSAMFGIKYANL